MGGDPVGVRPGGAYFQGDPAQKTVFLFLAAYRL